MGHIYFIEIEGGDKVKIGWTKGSVQDRRSDLQAGCPDKLAVVYAVPAMPEDEKRLHKRFAHLRIRGEWFRFSEEIHDFLDDIEEAQIAIGLKSPKPHNFEVPLSYCLP